MNTQIQTLSFDTLPVQFSSDAFLNATAIAKHFGKRPNDYLKTEQTQEYIAALAEHLSVTKKIVTDKNQLVIVKQGNSSKFEQGTWLHPKLAIHFARWLNPKFAVWCDEQIENLLSGKLKAADKTKTKTAERTGLRNAVNLLVSKKGLNYSEAYSMVHQRFNVESIEDLSHEQLNEAVEYVHRVILEGEVLDKEPLLSKSEFKALMHMFSKLCTYTMALRDLQNDLMLEERKLCYWFSRLNHAPEEGFFFFFKPNVNRDLDDAASLVHRYKKLIA